MAQRADIGLIGLGTMGRNLSLNIADRGYRVAAHEPLEQHRANATALSGDGRMVVCDSLQAMIEALPPPRAIMLMVTAGEPVDSQIAALRPLLQADDLIIDGGNSYYVDTRRRFHALAESGIAYVGMGVSGGVAGARSGPSIMAGGTQDGFARVESIFRAIAARVNDEPCCAYLGDEASGHFVKMIHNGIEYADMQLIAEVYDVLRTLDVSYPEMQGLFEQWNEGELKSYLVEITAAILGVADPDTGEPLIDKIMDRAGQKGTGQWASLEAIGLGVPAPTIIEAVCARSLSALKEERVVAERLIEGKTIGRKDPALAKALPDALLAAKVCAYAQGFAMMRAASESHGWNLDYAAIARIWRGGCIIRARFLDNTREAFERNADLYNLLFDPYFQLVMQRNQLALRRVVATAAALGVPVPALSSALCYFDAFRRSRLPANLIQAQRDYFGAHHYERVDRPGLFHTDWPTAANDP